jgi:hypothetical protein
MVWFTLIGAGGQGGGTDGVLNWSGGGSGAVTNFMVPAFLIPDILYVQVGTGGFGAAPGADGNNGANTAIQLTPNINNLLIANGGSGGTNSSGNGGAAMSANYFTAAGFFQTTAGSVGSVSASPSGITFLSGGGVGTAQTASYGYSNGRAAGDGGVGYFQMSPIIVGVGGNGSVSGSGAGSFKGGIGCGGGGSSNNSTLPYAGNPGGDGLAVIITW